MEPKKILDYNYKQLNTSLKYSVIMPIHNQERIIAEVLDRVYKNTVGKYELILILDNCTDNTEQIVLEKVLNTPKNLKRIQIFKYDQPVFETTCDNFGFKLAEGVYLVEVQADIFIYTYGYNKILTEPFRKYNDVISVSGRGIHGMFKINEGYGKLGGDIDLPLRSGFDNYDTFYVGDTCIRGPWALEKEKAEKLDYLDEVNFVLGGDDHDINVRVFLKYGWVCGYVPIEIKSPLAEGSTRKQRDEINTNALEQRRRASNGGVLQKVYNGEIAYTEKGVLRRSLL